jgi:hypothetical protein
VLAETVGTKKCPRCGEIKPLSSFNKDKTRKDGRQRICKICQRLQKKEYHQNNQDKVLQWRKEYYQNNRDKELQRHKEYRQNNPDKVLQRHKEYYQNNQDKVLQRRKEYHQNNPDKARAKRARRRAAKNNATPPWADKAAINAIYAEALWLQEFTGEPYHVDHIVPLKSDFVCGLHVPANLQTLPGAENIAKGNHSWPGQLPCQTRRGIDHQWWKELKARIDCGEEK